MIFFFLRQVERISQQKTAKNTKQNSGTLKNRSNPQRCTKYEPLAVQLEYPSCYQNNTSHYIILVSKELEKEPATSKKQRFYQKPETLQINTCLKGIAKGKNNKQKAKTLPKARTSLVPIPVLKELQKEETTSNRQKFYQKLAKASTQFLFERNFKREKATKKKHTTKT